MILLKSYKPLEYYNALLFKIYSPRNVLIQNKDILIKSYFELENI